MTEADIVEQQIKDILDSNLGVFLDGIEGKDDAVSDIMEIVTKLRADSALLKDSAAVHLNMLAGGIAKPSWANIQHLYPEEFAQLRAERDAAARDMRERAAAWHDEQCYGGHCGETTADKVFRQRHNKMHEESAAAILALPDTPAVMATSRKDAT